MIFLKDADGEGDSESSESPTSMLLRLSLLEKQRLHKKKTSSGLLPQPLPQQPQQVVGVAAQDSSSPEDDGFSDFPMCFPQQLHQAADSEVFLSDFLAAEDHQAANYL